MGPNIISHTARCAWPLLRRGAIPHEKWPYPEGLSVLVQIQHPSTSTTWDQNRARSLLARHTGDGVGEVEARETSRAGRVVERICARLATTLELFLAFTRRGHWYLLPLVVVLLSIGSLLVVAASSPLVAPFIYTLF